MISANAPLPSPSGRPAQHLGDGVLSHEPKITGTCLDMSRILASTGATLLNADLIREEILSTSIAATSSATLHGSIEIRRREQPRQLHRVYNEMLTRRPDLAEVLSRPLYRDRWDEVPPGMAPRYRLAVFHCHNTISAPLSNRLYRQRPPVRRRPGVDARTERSHAFSQLSEELRFDTGFNRGDMQFCNNHVIFHKRRAFEDFEDPSRKRHLHATG